MPRATKWLWLLLAPVRLRGSDPRSEMALDFQPTRHRLVVLRAPFASLDIGLDLQAARHRLIVLRVITTCFDARFHPEAVGHRLVVVMRVAATSLNIRFDFHTSLFSYSKLLLEQDDKRRATGSDVRIRHLSLGKAGTDDQNDHRREKYISSPS